MLEVTLHPPKSMAATEHLQMSSKELCACESVDGLWIYIDTLDACGTLKIRGSPIAP